MTAEYFIIILLNPIFSVGSAGIDQGSTRDILSLRILGAPSTFICESDFSRTLQQGYADTVKFD